MKTSYLFAACILFSAFVSCRRAETTLNDTRADGNLQEIMPKSAINAVVNEQLRKTGRFDWKMVSDKVAWSALVQGDSILSIGYQPADTKNIGQTIDRVDVHSQSWDAAKQQVLNIILEKEKQTGKLAKSLVTYESQKLPVFYVKASNLATVKALRASGLVRYVEPVGYGKYMNSNPGATTMSSAHTESNFLTFGCDNNLPKTSLIPGVDYTNITPGAKQSWNYAFHHIPEAWTKSTGSNIKVMLIDTGVSPDQVNLGSSFNQGASTGRTIEKIATFPNGTPDDVCGHGTKMAGVIAAPRGVNGSSVGVAYNSNLITVHAAENVIILSTETVQGVGDAYVVGGDNAAVKIISLSLGTLFAFGHITDGINYAYNKGKLMFCAAGTTTADLGSAIGVVYPAYLPQVQAVTGVKDDITTPCVDCHTGAEVAFDIVMEKSATGINPLTTTATGNAPNTVGGSSVAAASCAAIAALVWSRYPTFPRDSIVARMTRASSNYPNRNTTLGWGVVNANLAVGD